MDSTINTATTYKRFISCINNSIHLIGKLGYIYYIIVDKSKINIIDRDHHD